MTDAGPVTGFAVVIGVQSAAANLPACLDALLPEAGTDVEILLCHAADEPLDPALAARPGVRGIKGAAGALIPELWRDGILATRATSVGLLSSHCIPAADWLRTARRLDLSARVGYGGRIVNARDAGRMATAIHLLRYAPFADFTAARDVAEIAADNAVYRRAAILDCPDLLAHGFWEPGFHARFRAAGERLALCPELVVTHVNHYTARAFIAQRMSHGRDFGLERMAGASAARRWLMALAAPLAFAIFAAKVATRVWRRPAQRPALFRSAPWLVVFLASWSLGEARGYWRAALGGGR